MKEDLATAGKSETLLLALKRDLEKQSKTEKNANLISCIKQKIDEVPKVLTAQVETFSPASIIGSPLRLRSTTVQFDPIKNTL